MARERDIPAILGEGVIVLIALGLAFVAAFAGWAVGHETRSGTRTVTVSGGATATVTSSGNVDPHVAAGAHDFVGFACGQCHGDRGRGGVSPDVPALSGVAKQLTPARLRFIINHGLGESKNPTKPFMPVWGEVISKRQVSDLVAYLRADLPAVPTAEPAPIPTGQGLAVEGAALYTRYGCGNCHGPNGLGGVPNPQSPDKTIPSLSGSSSGRVQHREEGDRLHPLGSVIGRAPIVSMPHWGGIIPNEQLRALAAYLKTLK